MAVIKIQTGLRLSEPLYEKVCALASREQRSINNMIEYALIRYIDEYERANGCVLSESKEES